MCRYCCIPWIRFLNKLRISRRVIPERSGSVLPIIKSTASHNKQSGVLTPWDCYCVQSVKPTMEWTCWLGWCQRFCSRHQLRYIRRYETHLFSWKENLWNWRSKFRVPESLLLWTYKTSSVGTALVNIGGSDPDRELLLIATPNNPGRLPNSGSVPESWFSNLHAPGVRWSGASNTSRNGDHMKNVASCSLFGQEFKVPLSKFFLHCLHSNHVK